MLAFTCGDIAHGGEHIAFLCTSKLNRSLRLNSEFFSFIFPFKKRKMSVKQRRVDSKMSAKLRSVSSENCFHRHFIAIDIKYGQAGKPFMKMCNNEFAL